MTKILFVDRGKLGGPSQSLLKLLVNAQSEHEVLVLLSGKTELTTELTKYNIKFIIHKVRYRSIPFILQLIIREKIDLIYANGFTSMQWRVLIPAKILNRKFIWHIREILKVDNNNSYLLRSRVRFANQLIAVSSACKRSIKLIAPKTPTIVVHNGIDPNDFNYDPTLSRQYIIQQFGINLNDKIIVNVGTINKRKNQVATIISLSKLIQENSNIHLLFLGGSDNEYQKELISLTKEHGLNNNIHFCGFRNDIPKILCGSDMLLHTAIEDPHPRSVLEAMGAGLPVVAFDVDGVSETIVDNETGFLVPVGDVDLLQNRIHLIMSNSELKKTFGENGRKWVNKNFTSSQTANKILEVIDHVLKGEYGD